jgi:hypothetical protein
MFGLGKMITAAIEMVACGWSCLYNQLTSSQKDSVAMK